MQLSESDALLENSVGATRGARARVDVNMSTVVYSGTTANPIQEISTTLNSLLLEPCGACIQARRDTSRAHGGRPVRTKALASSVRLMSVGGTFEGRSTCTTI